MSFIIRIIAILYIMLATTVGALAHPHVWIDAEAVIVFDDLGRVVAVRHRWIFDEAFSAWSIQGLDTDGDGQISDLEMQELADENMSGLREYEFYTFAGTGVADVVFSGGVDPHMRFDGKRTMLDFSLIPEQPIQLVGALEIEVTDPEYYVAFTFTGDSAVVLENAPDDCSVEVNPPKQISSILEQRLFELGPDIATLPADLKSAAADLANAMIVRCGDETAAAAAETLAKTAAPRAASPFAAPPAAKGLPIVRTGFLGWINRQQQSFYGALNKAMGQLKTDGNAFWVIGSLSFLYGAFHAAGPGHGKVVISSYMLATQTELRRGVALSFLSAMLQSISAIVFVMIAAQLLKMTSIRLSQTFNILVTGSYVLVVLLGLWLVGRKLFGNLFGHSGHDHSGHSHDEHDHSHHLVTPKQASGRLRDMIAVVLAVGLRPCSGALVVLVFALSQGLILAGIASVFLMGIGTALTVSLLASLAVGAKNVARLFDGGPFARIAGDVIWWLELTGALLVLGFGLVLLSANV